MWQVWRLYIIEVDSKINKIIVIRSLKDSLEAIGKAQAGISGIRFALKSFEANDFQADRSTDYALNGYHAACLLDGIEALSSFINIAVKDSITDIDDLTKN